MKSFTGCEFEHERKAFKELDERLSTHTGCELYPNFDLFDEGVKTYLECDLLLIGRSFCAVIELKHWFGRIQIEPSIWYRWGKAINDPHRSNVYKCKVLKSAISRQLPAKRDIPWVHSIVVLTNPEADVVGDDRASTLIKQGEQPRQMTFNGMAELATYIKKRLGKDGSEGRNLLSNGDFARLIAYFDSCHQTSGPDYAEQIPGYRILEEIETTPRFIAYRVEKKPAIGNRRYRLRVFGELSTDPASRERQLRSLRVLDSLDPHPNIRSARSVSNERGLIIEETEWGDGQSLDKKLAENGRLHWRVAANIGLGMARALAFLHDRLIIHRHLTPKAVLVNRDDEPELCDFDVAYDPNAALTVVGDDSASLLTPYTAPEVIQGSPDSKSDVYSWGVMLFELLAGKVPRKALAKMEPGQCIAEVAMSEFSNDVPDDLGDLLRHSICYDHRDRFESSQLVEQLERLLGESTPGTEQEVGAPCPGQQFNVWVLENRLAEGRTAEVFLADNNGQRDVIKIYKADYPKERCLDERDMLRQVESPHIPRFRNFMQWGGQRWCLIEEAVDGRSLREEIDAGRVPTLEVFQRIAIQLLSALEDMHPRPEDPAAGVIHNDINPGNLLLSNDREKVWIIDFGIASVSGMVPFQGTPGYVDLALVDKAELQACPKGDLYGLGISLIEWLTGSVGPGNYGEGGLSAVEGLDQGAATRLSVWLGRAIAPLEERFSSAQEMRDAFDAVFEMPEPEDASSVADGAADRVTDDRQVPVPIVPLEAGASHGYTDGYVSYLNSIHNTGASNKHALAEAQSVSEFFGAIYEPFPLTEDVYQRISQNHEVVVVLTGHAGDGKSTLALDILKRLKGMSAEQSLRSPPGPTEVLPRSDGPTVSIVKDMSEQSPSQRSSIIERSLEKDSGTWLIVSNTGPLLKAFSDYVGQVEDGNLRTLDAESLILGALNTAVIGNRLDKKHELNRFNKPVIIANLTKVDNIGVAVKLLGKMVDHREWERCAGCPARAYCHIHANVAACQAKESPVQERVAWLYQRLNAYERRMTLRQMSAHLAYSITGGEECSAIRSRGHLVKSEADRLSASSALAFSESFFGFRSATAELRADNLYCVSIVKEHHFGSFSIPIIERNLAEGRADEWLVLPDGLRPIFLCWVKRVVHRENANWRQSLRRMVYLFAHFHGDISLSTSFMDGFLQSPMLRNLAEWQLSGQVSSSIGEKKALVRKILSLLLEEFSGFNAEQFSRSSNTLYITLKRPDRQVFQSAQLIQASFPFRSFELLYSDKERLPVLVYKKAADSVRLPLSLPMLDYVLARSRGELVEGLDPIYLNQLDQFRAQLLNLSEDSIEHEEISLLHIDVEGIVRVQNYELDRTNNMLEVL